MLKRMFRAAALILAAVLFPLHCFAAPSTSAKSCILMDADSGTVLYENNADERSLIASTTKIMTALVVLEHCDAEQEFRIPVEATGIEGSSMYLKPNEVLTIRELLYGLMLHSGNDAAVALAIACAGSVDGFVALMNEQAQKLGLGNTHFENPNGLDGESHYSTARDLAKLTSYALKNEEFASIVATKNIRIGERCLTNHNRLLWSVNGAIGVKTGYTKAAGRILVSAAKRNGRTLIAVTICDGNDWADHAALYEYGFSCYDVRTVIDVGDAVAQMELMDGSTHTLFANKAVSAYALREEKARVEIVYPRAAFCAEGAVLADVYLGERFLERITLTWEEANEGTDTEDHIGARTCLPKDG